jgi:hypothetical protein
MRYRHFHGNSTQHYYHLRTEPEGHFRILDAHLAGDGAALVTPAARAAHEAHRAEDVLMRAVNHYIRGQHREARQTMACARLGAILGSARVQRGRLAVLWLAMHLLCRVPRSRHVAEAFYRRWHVKASPLGVT